MMDSFKSAAADASSGTYLDLNPCQTFSSEEGSSGGKIQGVAKADAVS